jgi:pimeloyl-ACP methyl ester carboxylesterase
MHTVYPATTLNVSITYPSTAYPVPTYATGTTQQQTDGEAFFTSNAILHRPDWSSGAGRPGILACHGRGRTAWTFASPDNASLGDYGRALTAAGFVVLAVDMGQQCWGNNLAMRALDLAFTFLTGITGGSTVQLLGHSMGTLSCLNWLRRNPGKVTGTYLMSAFTDLDTIHGTADWTTPYTVVSGDPNFDLNANYTDPTSMADRKATLDATYQVTDDVSWLANAVDQNHVPARSPTDWAGYPIVMAHAVRDGGTPYQASQWWVNAVGSPSVKLRLVTASTASHEAYTFLAGGATDTATAAANGLPRSEVRDFFLEHR